MPGLVVEGPELSLAHDDGLAAGGKRTSLRTLEHKMQAVPDPVVGPGVDMRIDPALRKQRYQGRPPELRVEFGGDPLAERQSKGEPASR